jgi:hypothetical protein
MTDDSLAIIMKNAGLDVSTYQAPLPPASGVPNCSIVTSHNIRQPVFSPDAEVPAPSPRRAYKKAPRAIRKTTYPDLNLKMIPRVPDLKAMDSYVDSPLAMSRFDPAPFLNDFVFDNTPCINVKNDRCEDRYWMPPSRSVESSPSSSVSAISPVGSSPLWPPPGRSSPVSPTSPLDSSLVDVFENWRPFSRFHH